MKLVYATDCTFFETSTDVMTQGQHISEYWQPYLEVFDSILVIGRTGPVVQKARLQPLESAQCSRVTFVLVPSVLTMGLNVFSRHRVSKRVEEVVSTGDVVIARLHSENGLLAIRSAKKRNKKWAVEVASCAWDCLRYHGKWIAKIYAPLMFWRCRSAINQAPLVIYVTDRFLQKRYPNSGRNVFAVSDVSLRPHIGRTIEKRLEKISTKKKVIVLGLIGSLKVRYKGIDTVFKALKSWPKSSMRLEFRILGYDGADYWKKKAQEYGISKIVVFTAPLPAGRAVDSWLDEVDIYLQPSKAEGLPRALIEAMARGCPAIGSDCGGINELLDQEYLISLDGALELRELLEKVVENPEWQSDAAVRNWEKSQKFEREHLYKQKTIALEQIGNCNPW